MRIGFLPVLAASVAAASCTLDFDRFKTQEKISPGSGIDGAAADDASIDGPANVSPDAPSGDASAATPEASSTSDGAPAGDAASPPGEAGAPDSGDAGDAADGGGRSDAGDGGASTVDAAPDAGDITSSLVVFYTFDETSGTSAADLSGNGFAATLAGGATFAAGLQNNALSLSGTSQYASLPVGVVSGLTSFSVAAWVKLTASPAWSRIFDFGSGTTAYMFLTPNSGTNLRFGITTGGSGQEQQVNAPSLATGSWQHVAVTLVPNTCTLYVNGAVVAQSTSVSLTPSSLGATTQRWIGRSEFSADPYYGGLVDNFRVYGRALSGVDVQALYAGHL